MSNLSELYQEVIIDHSRNPQNYRVMTPVDKFAEGFNPLCGDQVSIYVKLADGVIQDISFQGSGCAISKASASLMTQILKDKTLADAQKLFNEFHDLVTGAEINEAELEHLGKLAALAGVKEFPMRVKCASLAWHTFKNAVDPKQKKNKISTEEM